jgi:biopolymer transport protein ExbD
MSLSAAVDKLVQELHTNPNLVLYIRADKAGTVDYLLAAVDRCRRSGITKYSFRTDGEDAR